VGAGVEGTCVGLGVGDCVRTHCHTLTNRSLEMNEMKLLESENISIRTVQNQYGSYK
jgi:hypothetical protein